MYTLFAFALTELNVFSFTRGGRIAIRPYETTEHRLTLMHRPGHRQAVRSAVPIGVRRVAVERERPAAGGGHAVLAECLGVASLATDGVARRVGQRTQAEAHVEDLSPLAHVLRKLVVDLGAPARRGRRTDRGARGRFGAQTRQQPVLQRLDCLTEEDHPRQSQRRAVAPTAGERGA